MSERNVELHLPVRAYSRFPYEAPIGYVPGVMRLDIPGTVLLLVDVYGAGFDLGDPYPSAPIVFLKRLHTLQAEMVRTRIRPTIDVARSMGIPVVYAENTWRPGVYAGSAFAEVTEAAEYGRSGSFDETYARPDSIVYSDVVRPRATDIVVQKAMYDAFFETNLDSVLRNRGARTILCAGFNADVCLLATAVGAMYRNYRVVVFRDATIGAEYVDTVEEMSVTQAAIRYFEALVGHTATTSDFWVAAETAMSDRSEPA